MKRDKRKEVKRGKVNGRKRKEGNRDKEIKKSREGKSRQ